MGFDFNHRRGDPVDPWPMAPIVPGYAHDGTTRSFPACEDPGETTVLLDGPDGRKGEVFGYVYELILNGQPDAVTEYIGKTEAEQGETLARTMAGRMAGHRSSRDVQRYPWKASIKPGRAGYRVLETVRCTGDGPLADKRALLRAEADWIDRRRPVRNGPRPVRPRGEQRSARTPRPVSPTKPRRPRTPAQRRRTARLAVWLLLAAFFTVLAARLIIGMQLPWAWAPWAVSPIVGGLAAHWLFTSATRTLRKVRGR